MAAGARLIHVDIMDGHFVPPITFGPLVAASIADQVHDAGGAIDVHLMIERPEQQIAEFAKAGADSISIHAETTPHINRTLTAIREDGCLAGLAINPGTPVEAVRELRGYADILLCMTVNPGWGGQPFIPESPDKVARLKSLAGDAAIEADGGIDTDTAPSIAAAGASSVRRRLGGVRDRRSGRRLQSHRFGRRRSLIRGHRLSDPRSASACLVCCRDPALQLLSRARVRDVLGPLHGPAVDHVEHRQ